MKLLLVIATNAFFGDTMSKGKKNDHVFHNIALTYLIKFYEKEDTRQGKPKKCCNIVHTDSSPVQYKC